MARNRFSAEFKREAVALVESGMTQERVCADTGVSRSSLQSWLRNSRLAAHGMAPSREPGARQQAVAAMKRIRELEMENEVLRRTAAYLSQTHLASPKTIYPIIRELAAPTAGMRVPAAVTCRTLGFSEQGYYAWLKRPRSPREVEEEHLIAVLRDMHDADPEAGYRVLAEDLQALGHEISERRVWRLCHVAGIRSTIGATSRR